MSPDYLTDLNKEQCRAVKHGIDCQSATKAPPLLVIAGAGSGKTKTLAHRVAHLVVSEVDPHRILLLTFTRRGNDPASQANHCDSPRHPAGGSAVVWYVPRYWRSVTSGIREPNPAQAIVYDSRPLRRRRLDGSRAS